MNELLEIEYKMLLDKDIFYKILDDYKDQIYHEYTQTNYYLTNSLLKEKKYMLRIREKENKYEMTLKRPHLNHSLETNIIISSKDKDDILNGHIIDNDIINILKDEHIDITTLTNEISLTTHRYDILLEVGTLSLDINTYNGITDYEIEYEQTCDHDGITEFNKILSQVGLTYFRNCPSKIKRTLDTK